MTNRFSRHAAIRMCQRAIPLFVVDLLFEFGEVVRSHRAEILHFSKAAQRKMRELLSHNDWVAVERWLKVYAVVGDDGVIVTAGHRYKRITRS